MRRIRRVAGVAVFTLTGTLAPKQASAQLALSAYALGVGSYARQSDFLPAGITLLNRDRAMVSYGAGWLAFDAAYEHVLRRQPAGGGFGISSAGGRNFVSTDWLPLDWEISTSDRSEWRHRLDRVSVSAARGPVDVIVGRQAISWATTLLLTPADPFSLFDPSDPFREYRGGVDAVRVRASTGPFTELEAVVRPTDTAFGTTMTALGRVGTSKGGWAFGGWAGLLHDDPAGALFASGVVGATSVRSEFALRKAADGGATARASLGFDRFFVASGKDLLLLGEVQFDGFGAAGPGQLLEAATSEAFARGDMQTLGRWTIATQVSYQIHPLVGVDALALLNADDRSWLFAPGVTWSTTSYASTRVGLFTGVGAGAPGPLTVGSEYGSVPTLGYLSVSMFF